MYTLLVDVRAALFSKQTKHSYILKKLSTESVKKSWKYGNLEYSKYSLPLVENEIQVLVYHAEVYHALHNLF